jgi:hypothetical protein
MDSMAVIMDNYARYVDYLGKIISSVC